MRHPSSPSPPPQPSPGRGRANMDGQELRMSTMTGFRDNNDAHQHSYYSSPTPPPPGVSPYPVRTPEGVLTLVQWAPLQEIRCNENVDGDFDDWVPPSPQRSNLTYIFPTGHVLDHPGESQRSGGEKEKAMTEDIPDFLTKVLRHTTTQNEE